MRNPPVAARRRITRAVSGRETEPRDLLDQAAAPVLCAVFKHRACLSKSSGSMPSAAPGSREHLFLRNGAAGSPDVDGCPRQQRPARAPRARADGIVVAAGGILALLYMPAMPVSFPPVSPLDRLQRWAVQVAGGVPGIGGGTGFRDATPGAAGPGQATGGWRQGPATPLHEGVIFGISFPRQPGGSVPSGCRDAEEAL